MDSWTEGIEEPERDVLADLQYAMAALKYEDVFRVEKLLMVCPECGASLLYNGFNVWCCSCDFSMS